jgi:integrase
MSDPTVTMYLERSTGYWHANVYWSETRTRIRPSLGTKDAAQAKAAFEYFRLNELPALIAEYEADPPEPKPAPPSDRHDPKLSALCDHYTETYLPARNAAKKSVQKAEQCLREFERYCASRHVGRASQLSPAILDGWSAELRQACNHAKTIHNKLGIVRSALNAAVDRELLTQSPVRKWLMPDVPDPEIQPLTADQLRKVLELVRTRRPDIYLAVAWMAWTGARPEDTCRLRWHQVDIEGRSVTRVMAKSPRLKKYSIGAKAAGVLKAERKRAIKAAVVFTDQDGSPFTPHTLYRRFTRCTAGFERHVTLKDLRHTFGSLMANDVGCPIPQLQVLMGHSDIKTTMRYVRASDSRGYLDAWDLVAQTTENARHSASHPRKPRQKAGL